MHFENVANETSRLCAICCGILFPCHSDCIFKGINSETATITITCTIRLESRTTITLQSVYYQQNMR